MKQEISTDDLELIKILQDLRQHHGEEVYQRTLTIFTQVVGWLDSAGWGKVTLAAKDRLWANQFCAETHHALPFQQFRKSGNHKQR